MRFSDEKLRSDTQRHHDVPVRSTYTVEVYGVRVVMDDPYEVRSVE